MQDDEGTRHFWEIEQDGTKHRVRYGTFESKVKKFDSADEARSALAKRIEDKQAKGFVEVEKP